MNKAKLILALILLLAAAGAAMATKARSFIGFIANGPFYYTVYVPFDCPEDGWGCVYTSSNGLTYQVYTLSGIRFFPVKP
ncbi:hypothetical protein [Chitinophaga filiformis]|uniref:Uncharacterized protein n=1 Tax=Chitinophaga filiformis TaxID=104663 RepID=A0A1G7MHS7_CHIFI|nr:hypothetical protein [Chitinophaga filiformis]SDF60670.1 hypothetical protein SAMN04488121_102412 [Chitinophaga filiformis]